MKTLLLQQYLECALLTLAAFISSAALLFFSFSFFNSLAGVDIPYAAITSTSFILEIVISSALGVLFFGFIPALIASKGFKVGEMVVTHHPRKAGKTKYGSFRLIRGFLDLMYVNFWTRYSSRPLHYFGSAGIVAILVGAIIGVYKAISLAVKFFVLNELVYVGPLLLFQYH